MCLRKAVIKQNNISEKIRSLLEVSRKTDFDLYGTWKGKITGEYPKMKSETQISLQMKEKTAK